MKPCKRCGHRIKNYLAFCDLCQLDIDAERATTPNTVTKVLADGWYHNGLIVSPSFTVLDWLMTALPIPSGCDMWSVLGWNTTPEGLTLWERDEAGYIAPVVTVPVIFGREPNAEDDLAGKHLVGLHFEPCVMALAETVTVVEFDEPYQIAVWGKPSLDYRHFVEMKPRLRTYVVKPYTGN